MDDPCPTPYGWGSWSWLSSGSGPATSAGSSGSRTAAWARFWRDTTRRAPSYPAPSAGASRGSRRLTWWRISGNTNKTTPGSLRGRSGTGFWRTEFVTSTMSRRWVRSAGFYATRLGISHSPTSTRAASRRPRRPASPTTTFTLIPTPTPCRQRWAALLEYRWRPGTWAYPGPGLLRTPSATSSAYEPSWIPQVRKTQPVWALWENRRPLRSLCQTCKPAEPMLFTLGLNKSLQLVITVLFFMTNFTPQKPRLLPGTTICPLEVIQAFVSVFSHKA